MAPTPDGPKLFGPGGTQKSNLNGLIGSVTSIGHFDIQLNNCKKIGKKQQKNRANHILCMVCDFQRVLIHRLEASAIDPKPMPWMTVLARSNWHGDSERTHSLRTQAAPFCVKCSRQVR